MELLIGFVVVMFIVAVVGHGIWLTAVHVFRLLFRQPTQDVETPDNTPDIPLDSIRSELYQLHVRGIINRQTYVDVCKLLFPAKSRSAEIQSTPTKQAIAPPVVAEVVTEDTGDQSEKQHTADSDAYTTPAEQRAKVYAEKRIRRSSEVNHVADAIPAKPKRAFGELLGGFLEASNIRWGEIIGGMLIVSCSTALVISFWSEISARPFLKFGVFNSVIGSLFLIGIYAHRKWKLPATSQGVLTIAMLLVPLNHLAIAAFTQNSVITGMTYFGEFISIGVFVAFGYFAARILTPHWSIETMIAATVVPAWLLLIRRWIHPGVEPGVVYAVCGATLATYFAALVPAIIKLRGIILGASNENDPESVAKDGSKLSIQAWLLLGIGSFGVLLCIGFFVFRLDTTALALRSLSLFVGLLAGPSLSFSTLLWKNSQKLRNAAVVVASLSIALAAILILAAGVLFAWPFTAHLIVTAGVTFSITTFLAASTSVKELHYFAALFLGIVIILTGGLVSGELTISSRSASELTSLMATQTTGISLTLGCILCAVIATMLRRFSLPFHSTNYDQNALGFAVASIFVSALVAFGSVGDHRFPVWILAFYVAVAFARAIFARQTPWTWTAIGLLIACCLQTAVFAFPMNQPVMIRISSAALSFSSIVSIALVLGKRFEIGDTVVRPLRDSGVLGAILATLTLTGCLGLYFFEISSIHLFGICAVWLILSLAERTRQLFVLFQGVLFISLVVAIQRWQSQFAWHDPGLQGWLHPYSVQAITMMSGFYGMSCILVPRIPKLGRIFENERDTAATYPISIVHDFVFGLGILGMLWIAISSVVPGIGQELALVPRTDGVTDRAIPALQEFWFRGLEYTSPFQTSAWFTVFVIGVSCVCQVYRRDVEDRLGAVGLLISVFCGFLLGAAFFESQTAVASATRWSVSIFFVLVGVSIWTQKWWMPRLARRNNHDKLKIVSRSKIVFSTALCLAVLPILAMVAYVITFAFRVHPPTQIQTFWIFVSWGLTVATLIVAKIPMRPKEKEVLESWSMIAATICGIGFVANILIVAIQAVIRYPIVGPNANSIFDAMGFNASYVIPLGLYTCAFVGFAHFYRSSSLAFTSGLLLNLCGTATFLFANGSNPLSRLLFLQLAEVNSILAAFSTLVWQIWIGAYAKSAKPKLLEIQRGISIGFLAIPAMAMVGTLWFSPTTTFPIEQISSPWGWVALVLMTLSYGWNGRKSLVNGLKVILSFAVVFVVCEFHRMDRGNWLSFHILQSLLAVSVPIVIWMERRTGIQQAGSYRFLIWLTAIFSLRCMTGQPGWLELGIITMFLAHASATVLTLHAQRMKDYIGSIVLLVLALNMLWRHIQPRGIPLEWFGMGIDFIRINLMAILAPILFWSIYLKRYAMGAPLQKRIEATMSVSRLFVALAVLMISCGTIVYGLLFSEPKTTLAVAWISITLVFLATISSCLWNHPGRVGVVMYIVGLGFAATFLESLQVGPPTLIWISCLVLSAFGLTAAYVNSRQPEILAFAERFSLRMTTTSLGTIQLLGGLLAIIVTYLGIWNQFVCPYSAIRLAASQAIMAQAIAMALFARGRRQSEFRYFALVLVAVGVVAFGWSWFEHDAIRVLDRIVSAVLGLLLVSILSSLGIVKWIRKESDWTRAAMRFVPVTLAISLIALLVVLGLEMLSLINQSPVHLSDFSIYALIIVWVSLTACSLAFALLPGRDPLSLSERQRGIYVYVAEFAGTCLFLHIRAALPWLFRGWFQQFWPLIVMVISFLGIGFAEFFRRQKRNEIAQPLENTGACLPILPALGYWLVPSKISFSLLMISVAALYTVLATIRKSILFGALAIIAANISLWHLLNGRGISILVHPQIWLIPPTFCVLAATSIHRHRMAESQVVAIRYFCAIIIYVSSTADIFINGVANAPWLPVVLAAISLLGVFAGILLRVRAFLFLGISFLMVSLLTVIWHAAVDLDHTWLWFVCGIAAGFLILFVFAIFEKKKQQIRNVVARLKEWEA